MRPRPRPPPPPARSPPRAAPAHLRPGARALEDAGVGALFTYEGPRDPFLPLAVAASATERVAMYTNRAIALPRSPMTLAYLASDLQRASTGRFALGLGTQVKRHITQRYGA